MKALIHKGTKELEDVRLSEMEEPNIGEGQVRIQLKAAGLNRRDVIVCRRHKGADTPLILGSDGAGIITEIGAGVTNVKEGDEVVINPALGWFEKSDAPPEGFEIVGLPDHGTFAEQMVISKEQVERKPSHLTWEQAAVLPLAALTAYRALFTRGNVQPEQKVMIPGIGGGVANFLLQYAKAVGCTVIVTSRSEEKRKKALALGADIAIDTNCDWDEALNGLKADLLIDSVGSATFNKSLNQVRKGGTVVTFGSSTEDEVTFNLRSFFYAQLNLFGSTMGSRDELRDMLHFVEKNQIVPVIDSTFPMEEGIQALERINKSESFGKTALKI